MTLTKSDCEEIYYALRSKRLSLSEISDTSMANQTLARSMGRRHETSDPWITHLTIIERKIGPDGEKLYAALKAGCATDPEGRNPAAVSLGRLGGLKGGRARAEKLSPARRKAIAKKAARARWGMDAIVEAL